MNIAIIEDQPVHTRLLSTYINEWARQRQSPVTLMTFENASRFLFSWEDTSFDLLFMDIQMQGMNGVELAKKVRTRDSRVVIVFTTGITDFWAEGYEVNAMNYLLKPLQQDKVYACLDKAAAQCQEEDFLLVHLDNEVCRLAQNAINYIEASGRETIIKLAYQEPLTVKDNFSSLEQTLPADAFIKCHRSYLCRIGAIHRIDKDTLYFDDGSSIPISRRMYQAVNQAFIRYFRK